MTSVRSRIAALVSSSSFDAVVLAAILVNSILLACVDYHFIDEDYQPSAKLSRRNHIIENAEIVFTAIFFMECILKIVAYGLLPYLRNGWNLLDFCIVIVSILSEVPEIPNLSVLRSFRVLRPLRSVSKLPSLRKIASAFVESIAELANVMVLLLFLLVCFSLFSVTFWRGLFEMRCRITPFPVKMPADCRDVSESCWDQFLFNVTSNPVAHKCVPFPNDDLESWTQSTSPWLLSGRQDCIWPIDTMDRRVCTDTSASGPHSCSMPVTFMENDIVRTCGSNYDAFGNPRFIDSLDPYGFPLMEDSIFVNEFNWGFTNFDNFPSAFMTTFQIVTLEGWSDILARVIDSWSTSGAVVAFVVLILLGGIISLNIVLAVISGSLDKVEREIAEEMEAERLRRNAFKKDKPFSERSVPRRTSTQRRAQGVVESDGYEKFILATIIFNTVVLASDHFGASPEFQMALDAGNYITTSVFFLDCIICNLAFGVRKYWSTTSMCFDGIIALSSVLELIVVSLSGGGARSIVSVLRSFRLFRLFKMMKQWKSIHSLFNTMARSALDVQSFGLLLGLFVFIYALVGMQLFANRLHFDQVTGSHINSILDPKYGSADIPRSNFDDFFWAVTTVFQVLTGENWNEVMYSCWKATSVAPAYFMSLIVLGVFFALNLFLAILLAPFDGNNDITSNRIYPEGEPLHSSKQGQHQTCCWSRRFDSVVRSFELKLKSWQWYEPTRSKCDRLVASQRFDLAVTCAIVLSSVTLAFDSPFRKPTLASAVLNCIFTIVFIGEFVAKFIAHGFRKYASDKWNILDFATVVASVLELMDVEGSKTLRVFRTLRVLRPLKMINRFAEVKVVVDALLLSLPSVIDVGELFIVFFTFGMTTTLTCNEPFPTNGLAPKKGVVMLLFFLVFGIFGVTFLKGTFYKCNESSLTSEELNLVTYPKVVDEMTPTELSWMDGNSPNCHASDWGAGKLPTSRELCECMNGDWVVTVPQNFNNIARGFALLFEISTTESWVDVMHAAIDQRGIDMQPVRDNNRIWALYFVVFLLVGAFFILELFVGVIIENFSRLREMGQGLMTDAQRQWALTQKFILQIRPEVLQRRPRNRLRAICYDFITHPWFDRFIITTIVANSVCIGTTSFGDSDEKLRTIGLLNFAFSIVFVVEATLKIVALERNYFRGRGSWWNIFDFVVVIGLIVGFILRLSISNQQLVGSVSSVVSLLRLGRLVRLIRMVKQLRAPFNTMVSVLPGMMNIGALMLLLFLVYAVCGMQLYGSVSFRGELNEQANFRSIGNAMLLLLRFSTGEGWMSVMYALQERRDDCCTDIWCCPMNDDAALSGATCGMDPTIEWCLNEEDYPDDCREVNGCGAGASVFAYFYSFTIVVSFIVMNMLVAIVLEAFEASNEGELLDPEDLEQFVSVWSEFDPQATWYIDACDIQRFLAKLKPPLGMAGLGEEETGDLYPKDPTLLEIAVNEKKRCHATNVACLLAKRLAQEKQGDEFRELGDGHPLSRKTAAAVSGETISLGDMYTESLSVILRAVLRFKARKGRARHNK